MSDKDMREAIRKGPRKEKVEYTLASSRLIIDANGMLVMVVEQIDRKKLSNYLDDMGTSHQEGVMEIFDDFIRVNVDMSNNTAQEV